MADVSRLEAYEKAASRIWGENREGRSEPFTKMLFGVGNNVVYRSAPVTAQGMNGPARKFEIA